MAVKMNERVPVEEVEGFIICFEALHEDTNMDHHFINECGWTEKEYEAVMDKEWFIAKVSIWFAGSQLAATHLGACCYDKLEDFYKRYASDYYLDMRNALLDEIDAQYNAA